MTCPIISPVRTFIYYNSWTSRKSISVACGEDSELPELNSGQPVSHWYTAIMILWLTWSWRDRPWWQAPPPNLPPQTSCNLCPFCLSFLPSSLSFPLSSYSVCHGLLLWLKPKLLIKTQQHHMSLLRHASHHLIQGEITTSHPQLGPFHWGICEAYYFSAYHPYLHLRITFLD